MPAFDKIVVITKKTALEELEERLGTRAQARFYLEQEAARAGAGGGGPDFAEYAAADAAYQCALQSLKAAIARYPTVRAQFIDRGFLPTFTFGERDLVVCLGPDGLVVNTAKYLSAGQPLFAVNPDPARIEGVLLPFSIAQAAGGLGRALDGRCALRTITMARAELSDGQSLHAVNDLFLGQRTHVSARYRLRFGAEAEDQSSSGIVISTGAGSTGWLRSIVAGACGVVHAFGGEPGLAHNEDACRFDWDAPFLRFSVREPWASRTTGAGLVHGRIEAGETLEVVSQMPQNGVVFSDGVEEDFLAFNSGSIARIGLSDKTVRLLLPSP